MIIWPKRHIRIQFILGVVTAGIVSLICARIGPWWSTVIGPVIGTVYYHYSIRRYLWRRRLVNTPFPEKWREYLDGYVKFYGYLDSEGKSLFENDVRIFIDEQNIYGVKQASVPDFIKVLIAASAAMLGHGKPEWEWPHMRDIIVYPTAFNEEYSIAEGANLSGMVHQQGPILFSERDLRYAFMKPNDGLNVALHELAHVMDMTDGAADGVPAGMGWLSRAPWIDVVSKRLIKIRRGECRQILRPYGGVNEAEFFAVAVEAFFERPMALKKNDKELYTLLSDYFNLDPEKMRKS